MGNKHGKTKRSKTIVIVEPSESKLDVSVRSEKRSGQSGASTNDTEQRLFADLDSYKHASKKAGSKKTLREGRQSRTDTESVSRRSSNSSGDVGPSKSGAKSEPDIIESKRWGYKSTKRVGNHPEIYLPRLNTPNHNADFEVREEEYERRAEEKCAVYALLPNQSHKIPDPYNTIPHKPGGKPGDFLQDYPGPTAPDRYSKINRKKVNTGENPAATTEFTEEPRSGLRVRLRLQKYPNWFRIT